MPAKPSSRATPLPRAWPSRVKSAILPVISLAQYTIAYTRGWAVDSTNSRLQMRGELDQADQETVLLSEELRIHHVRMARRFAAEFTGGPVRLSPQATQCLLAYRWPGNVRELRNAIQWACLLCRGDVILPEHLPPKVAALASTPETENADAGRLSQVERATILATLEECGGNRTHAAKKLGISRRALIYKLRAIEAE